MSERIILTELSNPNLLKVAKQLEHKGWIEVQDQYCYLKIDDEYIHALNPLLNNNNQAVAKPDYFSPENMVGAHISVIYPEERTDPNLQHVGQIHHFTVHKMMKAQYQKEAYYVLTVFSPSLTNFRKMHNLAPNPTFKGQQIMLHITIGLRRYHDDF